MAASAMLAQQVQPAEAQAFHLYARLPGKGLLHHPVGRSCQHAKQFADGVGQRDDEHRNGSECLSCGLTDATNRG
eukprot:5427324-Prymnesium_polylepis.1